MRHLLLLLGITISVILGTMLPWLTPRTSQTQPATTNSFELGGTQSANATFEGLLLSSRPATVTDLQGEAETMRGYAAYLRFHTDPQTMAVIIATGFVKVPSLETSFELNLHSPPQFTPPWSPGSVVNPEYYRADVQNEWTHSGVHYLIYEPSTGVVYFFGHGA